MSEKDTLRHEVIQYLSTGPMAFSDIQWQLEDWNWSEGDIMLQRQALFLDSTPGRRLGWGKKPGEQVQIKLVNF